MNRLKLIVLVLIIALLAIILFQNREPLALKLLCPDSNQACFYQTRPLPLAVWMGLFTLGGVIVSLLGQVLNRYRYSRSIKTREMRDLRDEESNRNWASQDSVATTSNSPQDRYSASSYEVAQEPTNVERSGSSYSYKYREASDRPVEGKIADKSTQNNYNSSNNSPKLKTDTQINLDKDDDDEDWV